MPPDESDQSILGMLQFDDVDTVIAILEICLKKLPFKGNSVDFCHFLAILFNVAIIIAWRLKGTGTRDLIWLKVVSLDRSWLVGLTDNL